MEDKKKMEVEKCRCADLGSWMLGIALDELPDAAQPKQRSLYYRWEISADPLYPGQLNDALYYVLGYHNYELEPMPKPRHVGVRAAIVHVEGEKSSRPVITAHCFECVDDSDTPPIMLRMIYHRLQRKVSELFPHVVLSLPVAEALVKSEGKPLDSCWGG